MFKPQKHIYRAWDTITKQMVPWEDFEQNPLVLGQMLTSKKKTNLIPMRYIGVRDQHKNRIFEGDYVTIKAFMGVGMDNWGEECEEEVESFEGVVVQDGAGYCIMTKDGLLPSTAVGIGESCAGLRITVVGLSPEFK